MSDKDKDKEQKRPKNVQEEVDEIEDDENGYNEVEVIDLDEQFGDGAGKFTRKQLI